MSNNSKYIKVSTVWSKIILTMLVIGVVMLGLVIFSANIAESVDAAPAAEVE